MPPATGRGTQGDALKNTRWLVGLCLFVATFGSVEALDGVEVIPPGVFHGDEVDYPSGSGWFALALEEHASRLVPVELQVTPLDVSPSGAEVLTQGGRKRVSAVPVVKAVVYLRGPNLRAGSVPAAEIAGPWGGLARKSFELHGNAYSLALNSECEEGNTRCEWILSDGDTAQAITRISVIFVGDNFPYSDSSRTGVIWAGDLDGDEKLDLIVDVSNHYNSVADLRVFLSSCAPVGQLVGEVAAFSSVGG